ncbi:predicted protein [Lichtheimia corymbifera JMRC:FSU:9682]|uniref:Secreted protein n=1 Tax=Lichtheimia corymbifera JMRC:FSU:9682 TaxID=1263082 RepID=A0A068SDH6_9FUNG|nr:predicted protein [Lichtheimia corymbifera JMRC:FSU:9682]
MCSQIGRQSAFVLWLRVISTTTFGWSSLSAVCNCCRLHLLAHCVAAIVNCYQLKGTHCHDNWIWYVEYDRRMGFYGPYRGYLSQVAHHHHHHHHPQQAPLDGPKTTVAVYPCIFGKPCERERIASYISPPIPARPLSSPSLGLLSLCLLVVGHCDTVNLGAIFRCHGFPGCDCSRTG